MNIKQQTNSWPINCHDFWNLPRNDNGFRSPDNPSVMPHPRDFHIDNIFASEHASNICAPYSFPFNGMVKSHAFPDYTHQSIANLALEGLHQQVMSFHDPQTKMTDRLPEALDIDLFLEEIFKATDARSALATPNSSVDSNGSNGENLDQQPVTLRHTAATPPKPEAKKRVTKAYSPHQKIQYVDLFRKDCQEAEGRTVSQRQFARKHQLSHARFSAWCKEYGKLKSLDASQLRAGRVRMPSARFPLLESRISEWIAEQRTLGRAEPTIKSIQAHARALAAKLGTSDFVASNTWVERFRRRCDAKSPANRLVKLKEGTL